MAKHLVDFFEDKARAGDGQFAIAYALMRLAASHEVMTKDLCFGTDRTPGGVEKIGMELAEMASAMKDIAASLPTD